MTGFDPRLEIEHLDLSKVRGNVMRRHGWSEQRTKEADADYRRFLYLLCLYPTQTIVPWNEDLDLFWHEHILDTAQYADDCQRVFQKFIHHDPNIRLAPDRETQARKETARLFFMSFPTRGSRHDDTPGWFIPTAATLTAIALLDPGGAAAREKAYKENQKSSGCGVGGCGGSGGGGTHSSDSGSSSCSSGGSCGASCGGGP